MGIFDGKVAIITGGGKAKSIGYGIAVAYAKEGADLVLTGRNEQKLLDAKEELERLYGIRVLALQADVTPTTSRRTGFKEVVRKTIEVFGRIDSADQQRPGVRSWASRWPSRPRIISISACIPACTPPSTTCGNATHT